MPGDRLYSRNYRLPTVSAGTTAQVGAREGDGDGLILAVDIGGTKTAVALVDDSGRIRARDQIATDPSDPWSGLARLIDAARAAWPRWDDVEAAGVGCGGPMTPGG